MERAPSQDGRRFSAWLKSIAGRAGAASPSELQRVLASHGCHCTTATVAAWLEARSEPGPAKMREAIVALNKALPDIDVWEEYRQYLQGREAPEAPQKAELEEAGRLLDDVIAKDPRLPPRLT